MFEELKRPATYDLWASLVRADGGTPTQEQFEAAMRALPQGKITAVDGFTIVSSKRIKR